MTVEVWARRPRCSSMARREALAGYLFIAPNFIGFFLFTFFPVVFSVVLSFTKWNIFMGLQGLSWMGFDNFVRMSQDVWFLDSLRNNLFYTLVTVPATLALALILALGLNGPVWGRNLLRAAYFSPYVANVVAVSAVWKALYNPQHGPITQALRTIGIDNPPAWLASTSWALPALMMMGVWGALGYNAVIYLAGLQTIPKELYEAAEIDGASTWAKFLYVTLPGLTPTIFFLLITGTIGSFLVFGPINLLTQGGPARATTVLAYYAYVTGFRFFNMGYASAIAWVIYILIFCVTIFHWYGQRRWVHYQ